MEARLSQPGGILTRIGDNGMAFPPNYNQERNSRSRSKAQKALDKQQKREDKSAQRKTVRPPENTQGAPRTPGKEPK